MANQELQLPASISNIDSVRATWTAITPLPQIDAILAGTNSSFFRTVSVRPNGMVSLSFGITNADFDNRTSDLSDEFEANGEIRIVTSQGNLRVALNGADFSTPYVWTPDNSVDVTAFYNAHIIGQQYAAILTISDESLGIDNMKYNGVDIAAAKYNGVELAGAKYNGVVLQ